MMGLNGRYLPFYFNDRRNGKERRKFSYTIHVPELRTGKERRSGLDRRKNPRKMMNKPVIGNKSTAFYFDEFS
jgi:hypothetical protein